MELTILNHNYYKTTQFSLTKIIQLQCHWEYTHPSETYFRGVHIIISKVGGDHKAHESKFNKSSTIPNSYPSY